MQGGLRCSLDASRSKRAPHGFNTSRVRQHVETERCRGAHRLRIPQGEVYPAGFSGLDLAIRPELADVIIGKPLGASRLLEGRPIGPAYARRPGQGLQARAENMAGEKHVLRISLESLPVELRIREGRRKSLDRALVPAQHLLQAPPPILGFDRELGRELIPRGIARQVKGAERSGQPNARHHRCRPIPA